MITVYIDRLAFQGSVRIAIMEERNGKRYIAKPMEIEFEEFEEGECYPDATLKLPKGMAEPFMKAMADALSGQGVKTDNDHKIQGTLDATKYHLEDLRKIVFTVDSKTLNK